MYFLYTFLTPVVKYRDYDTTYTLKGILIDFVLQRVYHTKDLGFL